MNQTLHSSELVRLDLAVCHIRRSGPATAYEYEASFIGLPLRGVFTMHASRDEHLLHPAVAVVVPAGTPYRMRHPTDDGDVDLLMQPDPSVLEEAVAVERGSMRVTRPSLRLRHAAGALMALAARRPDPAQVDELTLELLRHVAADLGAGPAARLNSRARAKIERVRSVMAEHPEGRWTLERLAALVGYSPFHLAHQFRAHTGTTVHRYLADVRAAAALERIEAGDASLAAVAADLGFAHHSHLTATLRKRLGLTPQMIRRSLD